MNNKPKLELTWIGKEKRPRLEPRILLEDPEKSYHAKHRVSDNDIFDNRLIFGDNLLALKALEQEFTGKVKCVLIDPPYNTGSAFTHYDDGLEHSIWLGLMRDRLEIIKRLLSEDGSLWITIDDNECHYLKVLCDEVFGRANFVTTVLWRKNYSPKSTARHFSEDHDYVLVYAKTADRWTPNLMPRTERQDRAYRNPDNDPRGPWKPGDLSARNYYSAGTYPITTPSGRTIPGPPNAMYWRVSKAKLEELDADNRIWWGRDGNNVPAIKRFLSEVKQGTVPQTWWSYEEVGHTQDAKREMVDLFGEEAFSTPKPERLLQRILHIASLPGDIVLDSFAGSGTTGAVAHKMGRRWIMVELGEHCHTHIIPRLKKVIDGEDKGGITKAVNWHGGGGFRYYKLAPSLIVNDRWGNPIVNPAYNAAMLAEALCKLEGFTYAPSETRWWQHGFSSERDFIYVTTQNLSAEQLQALSDEIGGTALSPNPSPAHGRGEQDKRLSPVGEGEQGKPLSPEGRGVGEKANQLEHAKFLRSNQTEAEQRLWYYLRAHRFMGLKFKRQKPIGPFIADFVCMDYHLVIEADGGQHGGDVDRQRDRWFRAHGFRVLRFWNHEILGQTEAVLERIRQTVMTFPSPPSPLPQTGEGRVKVISKEER